MCGIVGSYRFDGRPADAGRLRRQVDLLKHRGPDRQDLWIDGPVGLGHARLSIIDLSPAGNQPMHSHDGRYVLIYNGELYNFQALKGALRNPYPFRGTSDTEVLLYAFADQGEGVFEKLEGMFAIALYDRATRELWLVRDGFGIKPLYYHRNADRIVFSSEIKPLWLEDGTPRRPHYGALRQHLLFGYAMDPETAFEDIFRLPPGHAMRIRPDGTVRVSRYWGIEQLLSAPAGDLLETLQESAVLHSVSDVPTGIFLSGGLDSSMLLAGLARAGRVPPDFRAYNVGLDPDDPVDAQAGKIERSAAVRTCEHYGVPLTKIHPRTSESVSMAEIVRSVEEPICNPSNSLIDLVCAEARRNGTTVLLSGHGGDEIFAGYRRHIWVRYMHWLRMPGAPALASLAMRFSNDTLIQRMAASLRPSSGVHPLVSIAASGWDLVARHRVSPDWFSPAAIPDAAAPLTRLLAKWPSESPLKQMMLLDMHTYMSPQNLINMDKSSMRRSVEVRVPYLYRPLAAIGLQMPDSSLISWFRNKRPVRGAARRLLPDFLLRVPKLGFAPPQALLMAGEEARELLLGPRTRSRGLFRAETVRRLVDALTPASEHLAVQLYTLAIMEQWFRSFIDTNPVGESPRGGGHET